MKGLSLVPDPVAMQKFVAAQETEERVPPPLGVGLGMTVQVEPLKASMSVAVPVSSDPTAIQKLVFTHDTPFRASSGPVGLGLDTGAQVEPFQEYIEVPLGLLIGDW